MKQTTKMSRAVGLLEKMYNEINKDLFENKLPIPIITVQSRPGTYGHCSVGKIWKRKETETYELNIAAEVLNENIEETLDTMIHEMIHLYCRENGIQEVSRNGTYHNTRFKEEAEKRMLTCYKTDKYGYNTKPNDKLIEYALSKEWTEILINRNNGSLPIRTGNGNISIQIGQNQQGGKRPSSTRKYICPHCKTSIRATKEVNIICGDCNVKMIKA